jgi:AmiR/NasT family two-component response regulator
MKQYATEVEFLRDEVDKCHASMHSQIETLKLLMEAHLKLKQKNEADAADAYQKGWDDAMLRNSLEKNA